MDLSDTKKFYLAAGARIREARGKGTTQEQLANAAGLGRVTIANIEAGRQKLLLHQAIMIADVLGITVAKLIDPVLPKVDKERDLTDAGGAAGFVRTSLQNLHQGISPNPNV